MPIVDITKNPTTRTLTLTAEFDAAVDRVWELWSDPRKLERWWGPPTYPATFTAHELAPGGEMAYFMTGPEGDRHHGWWRIERVDRPNGFRFVDGFANEDGTPNDDTPTMAVEVALSERPGGGTRLVMTTLFPSEEAMEQLTQMGMEEGLREAVGQMDGLLER